MKVYLAKDWNTESNPRLNSILSDIWEINKGFKRKPNQKELFIEESNNKYKLCRYYNDKYGDIKEEIGPEMSLDELELVVYSLEEFINSNPYE